MCDVAMTLDKFDLLLDAINQVRNSVDRFVDAEAKQRIQCDARFCRIESDLSKLIKTLAVVTTVLCGLALLHKVDITSLFTGI